MRIAFLAESDGATQDATESRRVSQLWRAIIRTLHSFPEFIDVHSIGSALRGADGHHDQPLDANWDILVNVTKDPQAADIYPNAGHKIWVPPCDAATIETPLPGKFDAIWLWEDGPDSDLLGQADQILPDKYASAPDHSITRFPDTAILVDAAQIEKWDREIAELLTQTKPGEVGIPAALEQSLAQCKHLTQLPIIFYDNLEAFGRSSFLISDFSPPYRDVAITALSHGAKAVSIDFGRDIVLGGTCYHASRSEDELIAGQSIKGSRTQLPTPDDLTRMVQSALQSVSSRSRIKTPETDPASVFKCALKRHSFNPYTRLLIAVISCQCPLAHAMEIEGLAHAKGEAELPDTRCRKMPPTGSDSGVLLRIVVALPAGISVEDISFQITIEGVISYDLSLPPVIAVQRAGFVSVESDGKDRLVVEHWGASPKSAIDHPTREILDRQIAVNDTGLHFCRSTISRDFRDDKITVSSDGGVGQTLFGGARYLASQTVSSDKILQLKDAYRGQSAWLIGNGPSVNPADLDRLEGQLCFAFNRFSLAYDQTRLRPQFTLCSDRQTIEDFFEDISEQAGGMILRAQPDRPEKSSAAEWLRVVPVFPPLFSRNPAVRVSAGGSSPFIAMQVAHFLGIRQLYLYGMDFTYTLQKNARSKDPMREAFGEGNHFIENYRAGLPWSPPNTMNILMAFLAAREMFAADGGFIRNATRGGVLDIFERVDIDSALATS